METEECDRHARTTRLARRLGNEPGDIIRSMMENDENELLPKTSIIYIYIYLFSSLACRIACTVHNVFRTF